jgi:large subunit ribosomal protein L17
MRHQKHGRKLGRKSAHRHAMFSNMVTSLVIHERIETTDAKAKELKRIADRAISWGTSVGELTAKDRTKLDAAEKARVVHAMRMAGRWINQPEALTKLFGEVAPKLKGRPGGYTRVLKTRVRRGDAAPMSFVELVSREAKVEAPAPEPEKKGGKKAKAAKAEPTAEAKPKATRKKKSEEAAP